MSKVADGIRRGLKEAVAYAEGKADESAGTSGRGSAKASSTRCRDHGLRAASSRSRARTRLKRGEHRPSGRFRR